MTNISIDKPDLIFFYNFLESTGIRFKRLLVVIEILNAVTIIKTVRAFSLQ